MNTGRLAAVLKSAFGFATTKQILSVTTSASLAINSDTYAAVEVTALSEAMDIPNPTGTPKNKQALQIGYKGDATPRAITHGSQFRAASDIALPTTTTASKWTYEFYLRNSADSKWDLVGVRIMS